VVRTHPIGSMPKAGTNCSQLKSLNIFSSIGKVGIELGMNWYEAQNPDEPRINTTLDLAFQFTGDHGNIPPSRVWFFPG